MEEPEELCRSYFQAPCPLHPSTFPQNAYFLILKTIFFTSHFFHPKLALEEGWKFLNLSTACGWGDNMYTLCSITIFMPFPSPICTIFFLFIS